MQVSILSRDNSSDSCTKPRNVQFHQIAQRSELLDHFPLDCHPYWEWELADAGGEVVRPDN